MGHAERATAHALAAANAVAAAPQPVPSRRQPGFAQPWPSSDSGRVSRSKAAEDPPSSRSARPPPRGSSLGCPPSGARRARLPTGRLSVTRSLSLSHHRWYVAVPQRWDLSPHLYTSILDDTEQSCAVTSVHGLNSSCSQSGSKQVHLIQNLAGRVFSPDSALCHLIAPAKECTSMQQFTSREQPQTRQAKTTIS